MSIQADSVAKVIEIIVVIDKHTRRELEFHTDRVNGLEIKVRAGVPPEDDLALKHEGQLELVTNSEPITIFNHEHFFVFPPGTIS
jgi:hypothetical protein